MPYLSHMASHGGQGSVGSLAQSVSRDSAARSGVGVIDAAWSFFLGDKNIGIVIAGKISESPLVESYQIVLIYSSESLSKAEQHLRGNNCTEVWCSVC